jgi:fructose-1,6-bisphosphatase
MQIQNDKFAGAAFLLPQAGRKSNKTDRRIVSAEQVKHHHNKPVTIASNTWVLNQRQSRAEAAFDAVDVVYQCAFL